MSEMYKKSLQYEIRMSEARLAEIRLIFQLCFDVSYDNLTDM